MTGQITDYYRCLGIKSNASQEQIKTAFRQMARKYHPDTCAIKGSESLFRRVHEAYQTLSHPQRRREYDLLQQRLRFNADAGKQAARSARTHTAHSKQRPEPQTTSQREKAGFKARFFDSLFSGGQEKAEDGPFQATAKATLEELLLGADKQLVLYFEAEKGFGRKARQSRVVNFKLPVGSYPGMKLKLAKVGSPVDADYSRDLLITIEAEKHHRFSREGMNLSTELCISPWEAMLGTTIAAPGLVDSVKLKVPAGAQHGMRLRVAGRGLQNHRSGEHGDLFYLLKIVVPKDLSDQEKRLVEQLQNISRFNPR